VFSSCGGLVARRLIVYIRGEAPRIGGLLNSWDWRIDGVLMEFDHTYLEFGLGIGFYE